MTITNKNKEWLKNGSLLLAVKRNILHFSTSHKLGMSVTLNVPTKRQCSTWCIQHIFKLITTFSWIVSAFVSPRPSPTFSSPAVVARWALLAAVHLAWLQVRRDTAELLKTPPHHQRHHYAPLYPLCTNCGGTFWCCVVSTPRWRRPGVIPVSFTSLSSFIPLLVYTANISTLRGLQGLWDVRGWEIPASCETQIKHLGLK